jgi:hypothetical protein
MNRSEMNPYSPSLIPDGSSPSSPGWLRRFVILNGFLLAVPGVVLLALYFVVWLANQREIDPITGDPVTYEHFVWIDVEPWGAIAYFLVPNLILAFIFVYWYRGARRQV